MAHKVAEHLLDLEGRVAQGLLLGKLRGVKLLVDEVGSDGSLCVVVNKHAVKLDFLARRSKCDGAEYLHGGKQWQRRERAYALLELWEVGRRHPKLRCHLGDLCRRQRCLGDRANHQTRVSRANDAHVEAVAHRQIANGARQREGVLLAKGKRVCRQPHRNVGRDELLALVDVHGYHCDARKGSGKVVKAIKVHHVVSLRRAESVGFSVEDKSIKARTTTTV